MIHWRHRFKGAGAAHHFEGTGGLRGPVTYVSEQAGAGPSVNLLLFDRAISRRISSRVPGRVN